jgi:hypothetical protein
MHSKYAKIANLVVKYLQTKEKSQNEKGMIEVGSKKVK